MRPRLLLIPALVAGLGAAAPAHAAYFAEATDPAGYASPAAGPARDVVAAAIAYDPRTGRLQGMVRLAGTADDDTNAFVGLFAGRTSPTGCDRYPAIGLTTYTGDVDGDWVFLPAPGAQAERGYARRTGYGTPQLVFDASARELTGRDVDCFVVSVTEPGDGAVTYDTVGPVRLVGQPELGMAARGVPTVMPAGASRNVTLRFANPGHAATGRLRLSVRAGRGLTVRYPRVVPSVRPGARRTAKVVLTLTGRARASTPLTITATAGKLRSTLTKTIYLRRPAKGGGGGPSTPWCLRWQPDLSGDTGGSLVRAPC